MSQTTVPLSNGLDADAWYVINDGVMGGVSESQVLQLDTFLRFQGVVRLENNGGFASIRKRIEPITEPLEYPVIYISVRGDGQTYECRMRMHRSRLSYVHEFTTTAGEITSFTLPATDFRPTFRGRSFEIEEVGNLDLSRLQEFGILIANKQRGAFQLDLFDAYVK